MSLVGQAPGLKYDNLLCPEIYKHDCIMLVCNIWMAFNMCPTLVSDAACYATDSQDIENVDDHIILHTPSLMKKPQAKSMI